MVTVDNIQIIEEVKPCTLSWPQYKILTSRQQVNLFLAGQGSGKTMLGGIISAHFIDEFPHIHGFIGANTYQQLSDSTLYRIREVWKQYFNWTEYSKSNPRGNYVVDIQPPAHFNTENHNYDTYRGKICFDTGTVVYKGGLNNPKAHDGKEFAWAILDETKDTKEEAVKEVILGRLREHGLYYDATGKLQIDYKNDETGEVYKPWNPLFILTSPAKVQWINEWFSLDENVETIVRHIYSETDYFCMDVGNKRATISSTFHNRENLPSNYIENQMQNLHSGLQDMLIYGNPFTTTGGEFYKLFSRINQVIDVRTIPGFNDMERSRAYNKDLALHISFDFNVNPYITATIYQVAGQKIYQIDEICLSNPLNRTVEVCKEIVRKYNGHGAGMFIYGDPSGKNEDTKMEKGENNYTMIYDALRQFKPSLRVMELAPAVVMRGNFINTIFEKGFNGIEVFIHNTCTRSIADFVYLKEASDGTKLKEKVKNPDTNVTYEKYGHTSDSFDYFICAAFAGDYARYQTSLSGVAGGSAPPIGKPVNKNTY